MFKTPCPECIAHIASQMEKEPLVSMEGGVSLFHCAHENLGVFMLVRKGVIVDWSLWPSSGMAEVRQRMNRATQDTVAGIAAQDAAQPRH